MPFNAANIEERIIRVADALAESLPASDIDMAKSLALVNECGVALENLTTQIYEYDIEVAPGLYDEIEQLGSALGLDEDNWTVLKVSRNEG